jgi:hypothetical protein
MTGEERANMDSRRQNADSSAGDAALDFVRFCHRRRRVGWPELYDEMCHVAARGLYHGWGFAELAEHGIAFGLAEMPYLAGLVGEVLSAESERRNRAAIAVVTIPTRSDGAEEAPEENRPGVFAGAAG